MPEEEEGSLEGLRGSVFTLMGGEEAGGGVEEETLKWGRLPWAIPRLLELVHWCRGLSGFREMSGLRGNS